MRRSLSRGFTLVELIITIAIIAIMMAMAVPQFSSTGRASRERGVVSKLVQDFTWSRGAAGAASANSIDTTLSSTATPVLALTINGDCTWTTTINGTTNVAHSMTSAQLTQLAPGMTCSSTSPTLPATFTFTSLGFVDKTGTVTMTGATTTTAQLRILYSGAIMRLNGGQS
jgi:type IV fimbrial biogenesis protein FimT